MTGDAPQALLQFEPSAHICNLLLLNNKVIQFWRCIFAAPKLPFSW